MKYVIKEPESDEHKTGHKYPFNASELLSCENNYLIDKFFEDSNIKDDEDKYEELDEYDGSKIESNKKTDMDSTAEKFESMSINDQDTVNTTTQPKEKVCHILQYKYLF